jgi:hypothetical protein
MAVGMMNGIESKVCPHSQLRGQSRNDGGIIHLLLSLSRSGN